MSLSFKNRKRYYKIRKRFFDKKPQLNAREEKVIDIVTAKLNRKESDLIMAPITGHRYITSEDKSLTIIITGDNAIISNHTYHFDISLGVDASKILSDKFDRILESRRRIAEREIMDNMISSLSDIASKVKEIPNL